MQIEFIIMCEFSRLGLELNTLTKSADTAVVMREYGPLTRHPHTNSMPEKHRLGKFLQPPTSTLLPCTSPPAENVRGIFDQFFYYFSLERTL